jgi:hypothetical protein
MAESILTATTVGTSLIGSGPVSHRGFVDIIDCQQGVRGWALDLAAPDDPVRLQLLVGDIVVAEISPDLHRQDISDALGVDVSPGFTFDPSALEMISELAESGDDLVTIRFAGTRLELGMGDDPPRAEDIITRFRQLSGPAPARGSAANLDLLIDELRQDAAAMAEQALRPMPENLQGYIETLAIDAAGQVWMIGWMRRGHLTEFSAVISERKKIPAAVALMTFLRPDLPSDACGVIGLLASTWRPSSATGDFFVFFGAGGRFHLRGHTPLRFITAAELVSEYEGIRERCQVEGRAIALQRMLSAMESWLPTRAATQGFGTETSLDRILLVPGLGCLVEGWVVSPLKRVEGLRLRIGGVVMAAQADATYWKPRLDLRAVFSGSDKLLQRAGFVALFTALDDPEDFNDPMLKLVFEGGASANWPIPAKIFRRLGYSATVEDALMFFPALQEEGFFPRFADATIRAQREAMNPLVPMKIQRSRRALVMVLPEDRCDTFLLFEELSQQCRAGLDLDGVALIASSTSNRSDALWLFQEFQQNTDLPASLLVIDDTTQAFAQLPDILRGIGATLFAFVGPGAFLTESGWQSLRAFMQSGTQDLHFLALEPDEFEMQSGERGISARCFAWNTPHLVRWSTNAAAFLGGFYRDNGLLRANVPYVVHANAARNSRWLLPTRIQEAVNSSVYSMGARF